MKFKKITYNIDWSRGEFDGVYKRVEGYAINFYPVRICVRKRCRGWWVVDHYDSGMAINIGIFDGSTRESAAIAAMKKMYKAISSGLFQRSVAKNEAKLGMVMWQ